MLRYGILGGGMMGQEHIHNIALLPEAQVVAVADPDPGMCAQAQALLPEARVVHSLADLLRQDLDALVIATPNDLHAPQLLELVAQTQLPLLVEKPLCTDLAQVWALAEALERYPAPIWVAMEYRYMPPIAALLSHTTAEHLGRMHLLSIREHRFPFLEKVGDWNRFNRRTGGTLVEKCCHFFDLMRLIMRGDALSVYAQGGQSVNHLHERYGGETPDIIDNAFVMLGFESDRRAMLDLCMFAEGSEYQEELCVVGSRGKVECRVPGPGRFWPCDTLGPAPEPQLILSPRSPKAPSVQTVPVPEHLLAAGDHNGATYYQHLGFYRAITESAKVEVNVSDGLKAVVLGLAAQASMHSGRVATLTNAGLGFELEA